MSDVKGYEGWAIVELMGHRRLAGLVSEATIAGTPMLRLDVPSEPPATQFYGGAALYCVTPTTEEIARGLAATSRPAPVQRWELALPEPRKAVVEEDQDDDEEDGEEEDDIPFGGGR